MCDVQELFVDAKNGRREAFDRLIEHYRVPLNRFIQKQLGSRLKTRVEPSDIYQETALRAFRSMDNVEWRGADALQNWLLGIAMHVVQEQARRFRRQVDADPGVNAEGNDTSPSRHVLRHERFERLENALLRLSSEHRQVIRLTRIEGLPIREVAQRMSRSEKATSQLLWRAIKKLKETFGDTASLRLPDRRFGDESNEANH